MDFGLIFFASSEAPRGADKYRLVIDSAKFADQHGFASVWIPERHFTKDGWLYPNPAVLQAALARETQHIGLRAGSVVMPLHNPIRVAEEWAMVDNLSGGRVGLSFASGWHPNDFVFFPERYADRSEEMFRGIETVQKLWRGETIQVPGGDGKLAEIQTYPVPIQSTLPIWVTAAGNPKTFMRAGEIGANVLTHLYNMSVEDLSARIQAYREARARCGYDPESGQVSVMLHTFVWKSADAVLERVKTVFCDYLKSASYLVDAIAYSRGQKIDLASLSEQDMKDYLEFVFNRLVSTQRVLFGTPEDCLEVVSCLRGIGVTEIACQMDFGLEPELVLQSLQYVDHLKDLSRTQSSRSSPVLAFISKTETGAPEANRTNGSHTSLSATSVAQSQAPTGLRTIQERCGEEVPLIEFYSRLQSHGVQLAGSFQGIERLWRSDGEALGQVQIPKALEQEIDNYQIHPTLLDACFQVLIAALPMFGNTGEEVLYLPTGLRSFRMLQRPGKQVWSHAKLNAVSQEDVNVFEGNVHILDEDGQVLVEALGLHLQRSEPAVSSSPAANLAQLCYEIRWEPTTLEQTPRLPSSPGKWLIYMDSSGVGQRLADLLIAQGNTCIKVFPSYTYQVLQQGVQYGINPALSEHTLRIISEVLPSAGAPLRGVIHLWSLDMRSAEATSSATLETEQVLGIGSVLSLLQAMVNSQEAAQSRLWLVSRGAQPVVTDASPLSVAQSPLWGLGRTCAIEHAELWGGLVDVDPTESADTIAQQLLTVLSYQHGENQLAFRQGRSYVARLMRSNAWPAKDLVLRSDVSYLITGGLWGLGFELARWMAKKGARHLVLLGRTELPDRAKWDTLTNTDVMRRVAGIRELEALGAHVHYASIDVTDEQQLTAFLRDFRGQHQPPICGVVHAASVWQDRQGQSLVRPLIRLDQEAVQVVFRPKAVGSWLLYKLFQDVKLDFFVLFSSGASLIASAAQGNYAAAGAFLDVLAHHMRAAGHNAISIDWGAVSETGFGATQEGLRVHEYWESRGIERITPRQVLAAMELLVPQPVAQVGVLKLDWSQLREVYPQLAKLPLFSSLTGEVAHAEKQNGRVDASEGALLQKLSSSGRQERQQLLETDLSEKVAGVLRFPVSSIDTESPLTMLGLDSLMAIELKNRVEHELNVHIPMVTLLQGPSIQQLATELVSQLAEALPESGAPVQIAVEQQQQLPTVKLNGEIDATVAAEVLARLEQLSDEEVEALLNSALSGENGHI